jgi:hypothetical protein
MILKKGHANYQQPNNQNANQLLVIDPYFEICMLYFGINLTVGACDGLSAA